MNGSSGQNEEMQKALAEKEQAIQRMAQVNEDKLRQKYSEMVTRFLQLIAPMKASISRFSSASTSS